MKRLAFGLLALLFALALVARVGLWYFDKPLPEARDDPRADVLARRMLAATDDDAWRRTGAVAWTFRGAHRHLWDRRRSFARVGWGDALVLLDLTTRHGLARRAGRPVAGDELAVLLEEAWSHWCNDSFWLNPIAKLFDEGARRGLVDLPEGGQGLLVTYDAGGVTPGDSYLWIVGDDGLPTAWRMWTRILPLGGIETTWQDWTTLATGARIARLHATRVAELVLADVRGAASLAELDPGAADPFAELETALASRPDHGP